MLRLEEKKSDVAQVGEDEVIGLVRHAAGKVPPHNAVPRGGVPPVKLLHIYPLYMCGNVALRAVFLQGPQGALHGLLLHLLRHVRVLYHRLLLAHGLPARGSWCWHSSPLALAVDFLSGCLSSQQAAIWKGN
uniref:Dynein light chain n=1 Tax=Phasianus colchicus TaxID=9054 RepID=A0A669PC44_PHACC